jgi:hypothetical protein
VRRTVERDRLGACRDLAVRARVERDVAGPEALGAPPALVVACTMSPQTRSVRSIEMTAPGTGAPSSSTTVPPIGALGSSTIVLAIRASRSSPMSAWTNAEVCPGAVSDKEAVPASMPRSHTLPRGSLITSVRG